MNTTDSPEDSSSTLNADSPAPPTRGCRSLMPACRSALQVPRLVDGVTGRLAGEDAEDVLAGAAGDGGERLVAGAGHVRRQDDILHLEERAGEVRRLGLQHIQRRARQVAALQ